MKTELYGWPVNENDLEGFSPFESPAHRGVEALANACDFIVSIGTEVLAMASGRVIYIRQDSKRGGNDFPECGDIRNSRYWEGGNRIEICHGREIYTGYEHLGFNSSLVAEGENVEKGQPIAVTGYTGLMAHLGPHLHVERMVYTGKGNEDYWFLPLQFENEVLLFTKYLWDSEKWREIGNSRQITYEKSVDKKC
ncbi:MAG: M23 family metallopeptidase [Nanoarchaeota archaeon]|nr:M23 family metallopeptidase [Nanoarchaeota archaeon]